MPDISMCSQFECPKAKQCYRFRTFPGRWQSYISPKFDEDGCRHFSKVISSDHVRSLSQISRITIQQNTERTKNMAPSHTTSERKKNRIKNNPKPIRKPKPPKK